MLNKKSFEDMRLKMEQFDNWREEVIKLSRDVLKKSKAAIYDLHRNEIKTAEEKLKQANENIKKIGSLIKKDVHLAAVGTYSEALEEYTEASCYFGYIVKKIPTAKDLGIDTEIYLGGLSDLVGELVRKAINSSIKGDHTNAIEIREFVTELYGELMQFDFRNTPLRRKFDAIKYGLEKLEDLIFQLKIKEKI